MVHGWVTYIAGYGPRRYGAIPGYVFRKSSPSRSAAVYSGFTAMPSGVIQTGSSSVAVTGSTPGAAVTGAAGFTGSAPATSGTSLKSGISSFWFVIMHKIPFRLPRFVRRSPVDPSLMMDVAEHPESVHPGKHKAVDPGSGVLRRSLPRAAR